MSNEMFLQLCQWGMYAFQTITYTYINMLLLNSKWKHKVSGFFVQQINRQTDLQNHSQRLRWRRCSQCG